MEQNCTDGLDNDDDGRTDCDDSDCDDSDCNIFDPGSCPNERDTSGDPAQDCTDSLDNDGDGDIDCDDSDCALLAFRLAYDCPGEIHCGDNLDNDDDGRIDCDDPDCAGGSQEGNEISCTDDTQLSSCPGQDGFYSTGRPQGGRFVDNGDETATDLCTGLMWQREMADLNGDGELRVGTVDDRTHS